MDNIQGISIEMQVYKLMWQCECGCKNVELYVAENGAGTKKCKFCRESYNIRWKPEE